MLLSMRSRYKKQKGFSLLEALLAIVIIVAAGLGVVELYISADNKNKLQATEQVVQETASGASQYLSTTYDPSDTLSALTLINGGFISKNYIVGTGAAATINSPYGAVTVSSNANARDQYYVTLPKLPADQVVRLCQDMFSSAAIFSGATDATAVTTLAACQTTFTAARSQISFGFPKEAYV